MLVLAACLLPTIKWRLPGEDETMLSSHPSRKASKERKPFRARKRQRMAYPGESRSQNSVCDSIYLALSSTDVPLDPQAYKLEDVPVDIPPASHDERPLRRRRSRTSDAHHDSDS